MNNFNKEQNPAELFPSYQNIPIGNKLNEIFDIADGQVGDFEMGADIHPATGLYSIGITYDQAWVSDMFGEGRPFIVGLSQTEFSYVIREIYKFMQHNEAAPIEDVIAFMKKTTLPVAGISGVYPFDQIQFHEKMKLYFPAGHAYIAMNNDPNLFEGAIIAEPTINDDGVCNINLAYVKNGDWLPDAFGSDKDVCINLTESEAKAINEDFKKYEASEPGTTRQHLQKATKNYTTV